MFKKVGINDITLSMERSIIIAPSILSADFSDMRAEMDNIKVSTAPWVHVDVMDGHFVPNITFGPKFVADIRKRSDLFFDTHLMIDEPIRYVEHFAKAGSDCITVHVEACSDIAATLKAIKACGVKCGLTVKPDTPVTMLDPYLDDLDLVLIMSVNPGFGGQGLIPETLDKVRYLNKVRGDRKYMISIDGGVNAKTISAVYASGVDVAVTGSAFFNAADQKAFVQNMSKGNPA